MSLGEEKIDLDRTPTAKEEADSVFSTVQERMQATQLAHARDTHKAELGLLGRCFGGDRSAPTHIAAVCAFIGLTLYAGLEAVAVAQPEQIEFWSKQADRALTFATGALAFIFGRAGKSSS